MEETLVVPKRRKTTAKMEISNEEKVEMFFEVENKTYEEVAIAHGLDKVFDTRAKREDKMRKTFRMIAKNPHIYGVSEADVIRIIGKKSSYRNGTAPTMVGYKPKEMTAPDLREIPFAEMLKATRLKTLKILNKKLDSIDSEEEDVNLSTLATTFGILFDKTQIVSGEATENVAILAKIDSNMSPEESMKLILSMREKNQLDKEKQK